MPSAAADTTLSVLSNSANSSFDGTTRKSHEKTISGVFTYTNGTDVETGLPEHRLDHLKNIRNNSNNSLTNGLPNGNIKPTRDWSHTKPGSVQSRGNSITRNLDAATNNSGHLEGSNRLSNVDGASEELANGYARGPRTPDPTSLKVDIPQSRENHYDPSHMFTASMVAEPSRFEGLSSSPQSLHPHPPPLKRFSTPPKLPSESSEHDRHVDSSASYDAPRLTHRHTLQVPKAAPIPSRPSRDFSFSAGASEEAVYSTGRFSPTREQHDAQVLRQRRASLGLVRRKTRSLQSEVPQDDILPDEDAARWTEVIKQKRASRRKRKEEEDDDRVIVGKKVEEGHVNWVTAYNMLTGIRFTVSRTNAKIDRDLTDADFDARHKFSFDITGNELTPSAKYDFKFKDYSPWVFRHLRAIFGLDPADYLMSLTSKYILSELGSPGKSGSFFYFSRDYKYIIKTIHHAEHKLMRKILRDYYRHVLDNPNTLISQFYGLHRVKIPYGRKIHFVVMNNLFPPHRDIHQMFDLKGSTIGRDFKEEDLESNPRATLKDLNWLRRDLHLEFDARIKKSFIEQMQKDVALLQKLHIMDYSLLVGIHDLEKGNEENLREATLQVFQPGGERDDGLGASMLMRTPSRLENAKKARALRLTLKREKPVPMGLVSAKMPDTMASGDERRDRIFYGDDGGIRATHEDGRGGEMIYYLGIIDCLTHYGFIKRIENFWKGLSSPRNQISPIPSEAYGDRFINFITGITMTQEEAGKRKTQESERSGQALDTALPDQATSPTFDLFPHLDGTRSETNAAMIQPPGSSAAVDATMRKAQKQVDKASEKGREKTEEERPDRTLRAEEETRSSVLLPVVQEAGESGELNEKNGISRREDQKDYGEAPSSRTRNSGIRQVSSSTAGIGEDTPWPEEKEEQDLEQTFERYSRGKEPVYASEKIENGSIRV